MSIVDNPVYSKNVIEFITVAGEYCAFIEKSENTELKEFIDKLHKLLPLLYLKATLLPELDSKYEDFNERFVTEKDYEFVRKSIMRKLGMFDSYAEIFDPVNHKSDEPVGASISENVADMYQDLKDFILLYQAGSNEVMYEAIWSVRQSFELYWGQRLTNALRALHFLRYTDEDIDKNEVFEPKEVFDEKEKLNNDEIDTSDWIISRMQQDFQDEERLEL